MKKKFEYFSYFGNDLRDRTKSPPTPHPPSTTPHPLPPTPHFFQREGNPAYKFLPGKISSEISV
jgi:hypothetical protein